MREPPGESQPLYRAVGHSLREAITRGLLPSGGVLTEALVAAVFGTSRTPVKLALDQLVEERLLAKRPGRGFMIGSAAPEARRRARRIGRDQLAEALVTLPALRAVSAWSTIYDEIEREVAGRSVFEQQRLVESRLAQSYGVSRTVAHEVLMRLERLGLIEKDDRGRWIVVPMTADRVRQIYAVRCLLEPAAIGWAAGRIPPDSLAAMRDRLATVQRRYPAVSVSELDTLERDVHVTCISYCGNDELVKLLRMNQTLLIHNKHMLGSYLELPDVEPFLGEHAAILDRLQAGDGGGAARAMEKHLSSALPSVLERLRRLYVAGAPPRADYIERV